MSRLHFRARAQTSAVLVLGTSGITEHEHGHEHEYEYHFIEQEHDLDPNFTCDQPDVSKIALLFNIDLLCGFFDTPRVVQAPLAERRKPSGKRRINAAKPKRSRPAAIKTNSTTSTPPHIRRPFPNS